METTSLQILPDNLNIYQPESEIYSEADVLSHQKELSFMSIEYIQEQYVISTKSNLIKNILNQFVNFINKYGDQIVIESISGEMNITQIRKEFNTFCKSKQHNQSFLLSVMKSKRYQVLFQYFLSYYIVDQISSSKIRNIRDHLICIAFLQECYKNSTLIEKIITYKKRK